jgi:hypothetical protein
VKLHHGDAAGTGDDAAVEVHADKEGTIADFLELRGGAAFLREHAGDGLTSCSIVCLYVSENASCRIPRRACISIVTGKVSPNRTVAGARISNRAGASEGPSTVPDCAARSGDGAGVVVCPSASVALREGAAGEWRSDAIWDADAATGG